MAREMVGAITYRVRGQKVTVAARLQTGRSRHWRPFPLVPASHSPRSNGSVSLGFWS